MRAGDVLPHSSAVGKERLAVRSLAPIGSTSDLLLTLPGGPGLSGRYLDSFLASLDLGDSWNTAILDLPGHGLSTTNRKIRYPELVEIIGDAVGAVRSSHERVLLWGHSLGGRLVLDISGNQRIERAVLTGTPARFEPSSRFQERSADLSERFARA